LPEQELNVSRYFYRVLFLVSYFAVRLCYGDDHFASREQRYHIRPGDVVVVSYRYSPEYNATVSVQPDGFVTLPLLGDLKIGDLSLSEAHAHLLAKAGERLNDPEINIDLKEFEKPYYIVGGEVGSPGKFEIRGRITALRAVEMAGGIKASGKSSQILLIRPITNIEAETRLINLKDVIDKREINEDVELKAGDVLVVPKTRLAKIEPFVRLANAGFYLNPLSF
jgi:polysaccharide export outer membrane protein